MVSSAWRRDLESATRPQSNRQLAAAGVTRGALRGRKWRRVVRGLYAPVVDGTPTPGQRILDVAAQLPAGSTLGGWAAAYVLGVDWSDGVDPHTYRPHPVDVIAPGVHRECTPNIRYRATQIAPEEIDVVDETPITTPMRTAFDGARWAADLAEAVAFLDSLLAFPSAGQGLRLEPFQNYALQHSRWIGIRQALAAADLARPGVRSGWESRLRVCWQMDAGLPPPLINVPIFDDAEQLLGIPDLFDPDTGLVAEFDGDHHRDPEQHRADNIREERFESANLAVVRAGRTDVRSDRAQLIARLQAGHRRARQWDRRQDRWTLRQPGWWVARTRPVPDAGP